MTVQVKIYAWTKRAFQTHGRKEYRNRYKVGLTVLEVRQRIDQQDRTAIDEPLIETGSWEVSIPKEHSLVFDKYVRDLACENGAAIARTDKDREFLILPGSDTKQCMAFLDGIVKEAARRFSNERVSQLEVDGTVQLFTETDNRNFIDSMFELLET